MSLNSKEIIENIRAEMGEDLCILAHHYQNDSIVSHADYTGDSLELARKIPNLKARYIVMCGVYFMAESAAILATNNQHVYIPEREAGCVLSATAPVQLVAQKLEELSTEKNKVIPLAYVNTSAAIKAICAQYEGSVCTSANAKTMLQWAFNQGKRVLFLPDKNLAHNTANSIHIADQDRVLLSLRKRFSPKEARLFIWPGSCAIHQLFKIEHIRKARQNFPKAKIIVHPECTPKVVAQSDASGSTSKIIRYVKEAEEGSTIFIGTELNLVKRLAKEYERVKSIYPLYASCCRNMAKITEGKLANLLKNLDKSEPVTVEKDIKKQAVLALNRMLEACA